MRTRLHLSSLLSALLASAAFSQPSAGYEERAARAGAYIDQFMASAHVLMDDPRAERAVAALGSEVARAMNFDEPLRYRIINDQVPNAFAAPGGRIYLTSGLIDIVESRDELAGILAHEIAHTAANHYLNAWDALDAKFQRTMTYTIIALEAAGLAAQMGGAALGTPSASFGQAFADAGKTLLLQTAAVTLTGAIAGVAAESALKVSHGGYASSLEREADEAAFRALDAAGMDRRALIGLFKRLAYFQSKYEQLAGLPTASKLVDDELEDRIRYLEELDVSVEADRPADD